MLPHTHQDWLPGPCELDSTFYQCCDTTARALSPVTRVAVVSISGAQNFSIHPDVEDTIFPIVHSEVSTEIVHPVATSGNFEHSSAGLISANKIIEHVAEYVYRAPNPKHTPKYIKAKVPHTQDKHTAEQLYRALLLPYKKPCYCYPTRVCWHTLTTDWLPAP